MSFDTCLPPCPTDGTSTYLGLTVQFGLPVISLCGNSHGYPTSAPGESLSPALGWTRFVKLAERPCGGAVRGRLPVGCRQCQEGAKMVLFVTGLCGFHCVYCPVSDEKMYQDVVFADEKRVTSDADVLEEARAIRAMGAGITGGDPLDALDRTCHYIRLLKGEFGPAFHTHLYTMTADADKIRMLADAGLDELRFHVPPGLWSRVGASSYVAGSRVARNLGLTVGLEVPLLPERKGDLLQLIHWAEAEGLSFVNLNELEFSDANYARMFSRGYEMKHELSYGVKGSDEAALEILGQPWRITVHYCTSGYKDAWQLRARIQRRAENVSQPWEVVTRDGTLVKGIIEGEGLDDLMQELSGRHRVPVRLMGLDRPRKRIEIAPWILEELAPHLGRPSYLVEEYPTADGLEVERTPLP